MSVRDGDLHVMPVDDFREHACSPSCWCGPVHDEDEPSVWIHSSLDGREHTVEKGKTQ